MGSSAAAPAAISLGASMGARLRTIRLAVAGIACAPGVRLTSASRVWATAPVGGVARAPFLNAVIGVETTLPPEDLLATCRRLEVRLGRRVTRRWADRVLDLDVLLYDHVVLDTPTLAVPHPRLAERPFLLGLLYEAWPDAPNPWTGRPWRVDLPYRGAPHVVATLPRP